MADGGDRRLPEWLERVKDLFKIRKPESREEETGWDRVKFLFRWRYGEPLYEEVKEFPTIVFMGTFVGFMFGGMIGTRHAGDKFIAMNHHSKFTSTMQAQRELHSASMLGFVRHGCKWGWKMGLFATIFSGVNILLTAYRDKDDALNYIAAGGATGGAFRLSWGVMPTIGGSVLGLLISLPIGLFIDGMSRILIGSEEKRKTRERLYEVRRDQLDQWHQRLNTTAIIIKDIESEEGSADGLKNYYDFKSSDGGDDEEKGENSYGGDEKGKGEN